MNEMGLIIVSAFQGNLSPIDRLRLVNGLEYLLEAPHAAENFGRKTNLSPE